MPVPSEDDELRPATAVRRDTLERAELPADSAVAAVKKLLKAVQKDMFKRADARLQSHIVRVSDLQELRRAVDGKNFALANWCGCRACEDTVKQEMQASSRNIPLDAKPFKKVCAVCGKPAVTTVYFARAY